MILSILLIIISLQVGASPQKVGLIYSASQCASLNHDSGKKEDLNNYTKVINHFGFEREPICLGMDEDQLKEAMSHMSALVIPGGNDIDPVLYQEQRSKKAEVIDRKFDEFELNVFKMAQEQKIPVLGICKGLQLINVAQGGSLYQDLPSQFNSQPPVVHRKKINGRPQRVTHNLQIVSGSSLDKLLKKRVIETNSYHHQGIKKLGKNLRVLAKSEDGLIEAIENSEGSPVLALQFHPEKEFESNHEMKKILRYFFNKVSKESLLAPPVSNFSGVTQ